MAFARAGFILFWACVVAGLNYALWHHIREALLPLLKIFSGGGF